MERIQRIKAMEEKFDTLSAVAEELLKATESYEAALPLLQELTEYYTGGQWLDDYQADEAGLIPTDLKRGVLSQDGVYNLLTELQRLKELFSHLSEQPRL